MQLMLGKKHLGNERIYRKRMCAKSRIEIEILENLRKPLVWFCSGGLSYAIQEKFTA